MNQRKKIYKGKNPKRPLKAKRNPLKKRNTEDSHPKADDKYKNLPMKTLEERKAAQLEKWRKELGLDESD
ncbi:hypothetical protein MNBD_NITROSPINAE02-832 [hydrothermal vent metagenome]|uniref:Uncharacterized protein n=1 Tax=hydrothermal vent metagenome TaxID=652676 RepID=A0A3B1D3H1_9ZZZZ